MLAERIRRATRASACAIGARIQPLWGGYGELWRADLTTGEEVVSVIVKDVRPPRDDGSLAHRRKLRSYGVEQAFYARYAARCGEACRVFQYVGGGAGVKDVAYFLSSCFEPGECAAVVPRYLDEYFVALGAALAGKLEPSSIDELEREWRELFPLAWVDFYRFLRGWAPGQYDPDPFSDALVDEGLARLRGRE